MYWACALRGLPPAKAVAPVESGKSELLPASFPELERLLKMLEQNGGMSIEISGHTDNVGSDADNQALSEARAQAVVDWLKAKKIKEKRIQARGYGESVPVDDNKTEAGRQNNRRVEFKVLEK